MNEKSNINNIITARKIRLIPTDEQEILFWKSAGTARWAYNYFILENERLYKQFKETGEGFKNISEGKLLKHINNVLKPTTHQWLWDVSNNVMKQAVKDASKNRKRYFNGVNDNLPKLKTKHSSKPSFYVNYESLKRVQGGFKGERLGIVKTSEPLPKLPKGQKYANPRITFDGVHWWLGVSFVQPKQNNTQLTGEHIGIDLGIKTLAVVGNSQGTSFKEYENINKSKRVKQLEKRLNREQRKLSRQTLNNIESYDENRKPIYKKPLRECKNIQKQCAKIKNIYQKLTNIRDNHLHQTTTEIVKTKPSRIVMEDLNVKGMMKNKHLSKAIRNQKFYTFREQIEYKCEKYGIEFVKADMWFPSSKTCSCCGNIKKDLNLKDRTYKCLECGLVLDRDKNASINLANYQKK